MNNLFQRKIVPEDIKYFCKKLIYLAAPYSDKSENAAAVMEERFKRINKVASKLMAQGEYIFSPISHTHPIALAGELPRGWDFWEGYDKCMISCCGKLYVLTIDGWARSVGVNAEMQIADNLGIPVFYITEDLVITPAYGLPN